MPLPDEIKAGRISNNEENHVNLMHCAVAGG